MSWQAAVLMSAGIIVLVFAILAIVFAMIRRSIAKEAAALADVELDSGPVRLVTRFRQFRSARLYKGRAYTGTPAQIVLTKTHLHLLQRPQLYGVFARDQLSRFTVGTIDGQLHLVSDDPPDASGHIDYRARVRDPDAWVKALAAAGMRRAA